MRRWLIGGNWKMNTTRSSAIELASAIRAGFRPRSDVTVVLFPPFPYLDAVRDVLTGSAIALGAQNVYFERKGAFTGEVSAMMLVDLGCRYSLVGHSERRHKMGESDTDVQRKIDVALEAGLHVVVCVGETLDQRQRGLTSVTVTSQVEAALARIPAEAHDRIAFAYEPVWAIGTGQTATPAQADEVHTLIRDLVVRRFSGGDDVLIQYGGSVTAANAGELLTEPNVNGALVGGASLQASDFLAIIGSVPTA